MSRILTFLLLAQNSLQVEECGNPGTPEVVESTAYGTGEHFPASNVLVLGEEDAWVGCCCNYWLAEQGKTTGQGFTLKIGKCPMLIAGCQIKNKGKGVDSARATKEFRVSGSVNQNGPWETLVHDELVDTRNKAASLLNFTFDELVEVQFIRFDLISYWGGLGGGLQYFAAIPATGETTTNGAITTTTVEVTIPDAKQETGLDFKTIGHYTIFSILAAIAIFGVGFMIRTNCKIREKCCKCCVDLEKRDINLDYGTYYCADNGERRQDVMEVEDSNPAYESTNAESNQATEINPKDDENSRLNSADQLDEYDYMGIHDDYDYMG